MAPLVSVVMPVFDGRRWLEESVGSILGQTWRAIEWIAVDDGSTDGSADVLADLARRATAGGIAVHLVTTDRTGVARARNAGLAVATGEFVAFLDQDDVWVPDCLERQVACLAAAPSRFAACDLEWLGPSPDGRATFPPPEHVAPSTYEGAWRRIGITTPGCVLARREDVVAAGGFPEDPAYAGADDRGLWLELVARGVLPVRNPFVGLRYRLHAAQQSRTLRHKRAKVALSTAYAARTMPGSDRPLVSDAVARPRLAALRMDLACDLLDSDLSEADGQAEAARRLDPAVAASDLGRAFARKRRRRRLAALPLIGPVLRGLARRLRARG